MRRSTIYGRAAASAGGRSDAAEQHIPRVPVVLRGIAASSTLVLVLFRPLGIGKS